MILFLVLIFIMKCNDKIMILFFSKSGSKPEENGLTQISVQFFFYPKINIDTFRTSINSKFFVAVASKKSYS